MMLLCIAAVVCTVAEAQSPPAWPTPVATPTPETSPAPTEVPASEAEAAPTPAEVVEPTPTEEPEGVDATDPAPTAPPVSKSGGDDETTPKSEQVTNPGDVAFTDYAPFDLDEIEPEPMKSKWGRFMNGVRGIARYSLFDGQVKFRIGGRIQIDGTAGTSDDRFEEYYSPINSTLDIRRFSLFAAGRIKNFNTNLAFEFGPDWGFTDAWIEGSEGGLEVWGKYLGKLRAGFMKEPFGFERQASSYHTPLLERSLPVQTISPGTNAGVMVHDAGAKGRFTWAAGLFSFGQSNDSNASASALSITGRVTYNPVYRDNGRKIIHVGASLSSRSPASGGAHYRSRPEARFVGYLVDTGKIDASHLLLWAVEFVTIQGPLWIAAEHIESQVSAQVVGDPTFRGSYVQVGWILSGESRPYRKNSATWDRAMHTNKYRGGNPFKKKNGGSWELVGRISNIDLNDGLIEGGQLTDISAGLNWYLNPTTRVELNYVHAAPKDRGSADIFLLRVQYQPW